MSTIAICIDESAVPPTTIIKLQRLTGHSLNDIRDRIRQRRPIFEREIFDAQYVEHASKIRAIVDCLDGASIPNRIYELPEGETMETHPHVSQCQIAIEVLKNILDQADLEADRPIL